jgi:hypothetical protein
MKEDAVSSTGDPGPNPAWGQPEKLHPVQIEGLRRMSPARKMELLVQMYHAGIAFKMAGLRMQHPDWTEEQLLREARRCAMYART